MDLKVLNGLSDIDPTAWDALVGDGSPFLEWGWLASLEDSGCVRADTGWLPQHLTLWDGARLIGACPLYVKGHSQGEFVFDHGWADAAQRAGIRYYPKLLVAVPFTPATGARFLTQPDADRPALMQTLGNALKEICSANGLSTAHVNFCVADEVEALGALGFDRRSGYQFQWINPGWRTFDDYLAAFRSKRRIQIRRERRELESQGVEITVHAGDAIADDLFAAMFRLYKSTIDKLYWGRQYLNAELFDLLRRRWKRRLCFFVARRKGTIVAGTFTVRKGGVLYGRYWGAFEELRYLHFNVCYYAAIEHCLREGVTRFEPGAGGEFKHLRGFDAQPTVSMHYIADPRFARAVRDYLAKERTAVAHEIEWLDEQSPLKRET
ncbi:MAG TPA: GNAT family N-acetyltransferase [Candidatus Acidoferrales bacterium]|nr:GNAT family N-acetyltransferase [Candidatus Acidoferrales bacterium]